MTCAPPSGTKDGTWHWLNATWAEDGSTLSSVNEWKAGRWRFGGMWHEVEIVTRLGWRYHSPVPTPEEVEALRRLARAIEDHRVDNVPHWLQEACRRAGLWKLQAHGSNLGRYQTNELTDLGRRALGQERNET